MPFAELPPHVPDDNETGLYRRSFEVPRGWRRRPRRPLVRRLRGRAVRRSSTASRSASRRTRALPPSSTSPSSCTTTARTSSSRPSFAGRMRRFIEDQDQWWHAGLPRSIALVSPSIGELDVRAELDDGFRRRPADGALGRGRRRAPRSTPAVASSRRARSPTASFECAVRAPRLWSAEQPDALHARAERRAARRSRATSASGSVEVRDRALLVNGEPVRINGVNRHEHDDRTGRALTRESMETRRRC